MSKLQLRVGAYYLNGRGEVVGPMGEYSGALYRFTSPNHGAFSANGCWDVNHPSRLDLVSEAAKPLAEGRDAKGQPLPNSQKVSESDTLCAARISQEENNPDLSLNRHETELERLVRVANAGESAAARLRASHLGEYELTEDGGSNWVSEREGVLEYQLVQYRANPKPKRRFPEFYVGPVREGYGTETPPWHVRMDPDGTTLRVGCLSFDAKELHKGLTYVCAQKGRSWNPLTLEINRNGVKHYNSGHEITWADADRLLAALEAWFAEEKS